MEGVMMKNEDRYAVAVRKPDHTIDVKVSTFKETIKNKNCGVCHSSVVSLIL